MITNERKAIKLKPNGFHLQFDFFKMLLKLVLVLFFLEVSGNIAFKKFVGSKIISGEKSPKHYPYQISLQGYSPKSLPRKFRHFCGGCIISENFFLTAAHCIYGQNISEIVVLAGTSSLKYKEGELLLPIASCVSHPQYILVNTSDIALCKVQIPFVFGKDIGKINLDKSIVGPNENCLLTGWGSVSMIRWLPIPFFDKFAYPDNLMRVNLPTISNEECSNKIKRKIDDTQICTYSRFGQGSCSG